MRMDDIATEMGISKRTLYEIYSNKEDLLFECLRSENELMDSKLTEYAVSAENEMAVIAYFIKPEVERPWRDKPSVLYGDGEVWAHT